MKHSKKLRQKHLSLCYINFCFKLEFLIIWQLSIIITGLQLEYFPFPFCWIQNVSYSTVCGLCYLILLFMMYPTFSIGDRSSHKLSTKLRCAMQYLLLITVFIVFFVFGTENPTFVFFSENKPKRGLV